MKKLLKAKIFLIGVFVLGAQIGLMIDDVFASDSEAHLPVIRALVLNRGIYGFASGDYADEIVEKAREMCERSKTTERSCKNSFYVIATENADMYIVDCAHELGRMFIFSLTSFEQAKAAAEAEGFNCERAYKWKAYDPRPIRMPEFEGRYRN